MSLFLSVLAIFLSVLAMFCYQLITVFPKLGIGYLYHIRRIRIVWSLTALGMAAAAYAMNPTTGQIWVIILTVLLTPLSGANHAKRFLVSLNKPPHASTVEAGLAGSDEILGVVIGKTAVAYPLKLLIPHHLINDRVEKTAVLACW